MRRRGLSSPAQLFKVGRAALLHQHSSQKPTAPPRFSAAMLISRSRRLFSFVQGVGGGDPPLRPHPSDPEKTRKRRPDGLPRDPPFDKPLLKGNLGCHLKRPEARVPTKLPRRAVEHLPQCLGAPLVEGVAGALRARRLRDESIQTLLVEVVDGVAYRLLAASEVLGDLRNLLAPRTRHKHL